MTPRSALKAAVAAWNDGDLEAYLKLYADEAVLHGAEGTLDLAGARAFYAAMWERVPGARIELEEIWEHTDRVGCRFAVSDPHGFRLEGVTILRFAGGRCVERMTVAEPRLSPGATAG